MKRLLRSDDAGSMLVETLIETGILVVVMAGVMSIGVVSMTHTENQGHLAARATEYAQDKMEQLVALAYGDAVSDTRVFPAATSGGTGLAPGGSSTTSAPAAGYVDYLDQNGNLCGSTSALAATPPCAAPVGTTPPASWFYQRVWKVDDSTTDGTLP